MFGPTRRDEPTRERGRKLLIDQEIQLRYAKHDVVRRARAVFERGCNISRFQIGVVGKNFLSVRTRGKEFEDVPHSDAQATQAGPSPTHLRIKRHARQFAHFISS